MRDEATMMALIVGVAAQDARVRAVVQSGSRTNPAIRPDSFQDYDVIYVVTRLEEFLADEAWLSPFGERMIMQTPDGMGSRRPLPTERFAYLMQFADGNRIDLTLVALDTLDAFRFDSLSQVLLDKDNRLPPLPAPSERDYLPTPPRATEFADCCNEFWWVAPYVAKGLCRDQLPYARHHLDTVLRAELTRMLTWLIGQRSEFAVNVGAHGKAFAMLLRPGEWQRLTATYAAGSNEATWHALFAGCALFREAAQAVAAAAGFDYPQGDDDRVSAYLHRLYQRCCNPH
ncbi:MAG: aminoglycoside 6-adenylyltransferase [Anaerolineales bacterium]|nr:aminoglycoside 6-adenylyltransferase [Anaerolineales bacterium]MCB9171328.1 aminoglycoside 6-adenylyltransferase [Ardenticatenales bacterium]